MGTKLSLFKKLTNKSTPIDNNYIKYIRILLCDVKHWSKLDQMPRLKSKYIDNINTKNTNPHNKLILYTYYGYLNKLKKYNVNELNERIIMYYDDPEHGLKYCYIYLIAAYCGHIKILKYLDSIDTKLKQNICDQNFQNALIYAIRNNKLETVKYLISIGFNKFSIYLKMFTYNYYMYTLALEKKNIKIIKYLDSIDAINYSYKSYELSLYNKKRNKQILKFLESKGFTYYKTRSFKQNYQKQYKYMKLKYSFIYI